MTHYRNTALAVLLALWSAVSAQDFAAERLRRAAAAAGVAGRIDSLPAGQTSLLTANDGLTVSVRVSDSRMVEHIGIPLFHADMRTLMPSPVYDFMEYAVLNKHYKVNPNDLYLSKVLFRTGSWQSLVKAQLQDAECTISNEADKLYIVSWQRPDGEVLAEVGVPIEYELLNNDTRRNMERDLIRHLKAYQTQPTAPKAVKEDDLKVYGAEGLFVLPGRDYLLPELNSNVYYELKTTSEEIDTVYYGKPVRMTLEDVVPFVVISEEHPAETMANLLLSDELATAGTSLLLDFHLSDYHREVVRVSALQWREFCRRQGGQLFFAYRGRQDDGTQRGTLMVHNAAKGYNHLLTLRIANGQLTSLQPEIQGDVYLYIPPIDKSKLFGQPPTKKSGAKIY